LQLQYHIAESFALHLFFAELNSLEHQALFFLLLPTSEGATVREVMIGIEKRKKDKAVLILYL